jgi:hypothetical protein
MVLDELGIGGPSTDATRYLRIVVLRNRLMDDPSWTDDVTERGLEAIRTNAPDEVDKVVHRISRRCANP